MSTHNIYVIELDKEVLKKKKFREANPDYVDSSPCVYVGMTSKSPEERFKQHKEGHKAARIVKQFGTRLKPRHHLPPMSMSHCGKHCVNADGSLPKIKACHPM